jgi:hypothetical protein
MSQLDTTKGEEVLFSCSVIKYNRWGMKQERTLLLTNLNLFNIKKDQIQRRIYLSSVKALTKSMNPNNSQFIVHVRSEYDYMYESDFRKEIFDAIKYAYWKANSVNLPVYGVPDKVKEYHTSKKDISNGIEINPQENYRLKNEDIYEENLEAKAKQEKMNTQPQEGSSDSDFQMFGNEMKGRSDTLFQKN